MEEMEEEKVVDVTTAKKEEGPKSTEKLEDLDKFLNSWQNDTSSIFVKSNLQTVRKVLFEIYQEIKVKE